MTWQETVQNIPMIIGTRSGSLANSQREEDTTLILFTRKSKFEINKVKIFELYRMYIYGGHDIREGSMDNLWVIDLQSFDDLDREPEDQERDCAWKLKETKGDPKPPKDNQGQPGALSHHSSVVYNEKMYLFGGSYASGE